jgi:hypothetical protein
MPRALAWAVTLVACACGGRSASGGGAGNGDDGGATSQGATAGTGNGTNGSGTGGTSSSAPAGTAGSVGGPAPGPDCEQLTTADACRGAGCYAFLGTSWTRDASSGGQGGTPPDRCTIHQDRFFICRDDGSGGAVVLFGCDQDCTECGDGAAYLPKGWGPGGALQECAWKCNNEGFVVPLPCAAR